MTYYDHVFTLASTDECVAFFVAFAYNKIPLNPLNENRTIVSALGSQAVGPVLIILS